MYSLKIKNPEKLGGCPSANHTSAEFILNKAKGFSNRLYLADNTADNAADNTAETGMKLQ